MAQLPLIEPGRSSSIPGTTVRATVAAADRAWLDLEPEPLPSRPEHVCDLLSQAVSMTEPWWHDRGVRLDLQPGCTEPLAWSSRRLVWCLVNLVLAYAKAMDPGQVLRVSTWQEDGCVHLHFDCEACGVEAETRLRHDESLGSFWTRAQHFARSVSADLQFAASRLSADLRVPIGA